MAERIDPRLAVAMAKASGLDASDLERQIASDDRDHEMEALLARISELEEELAAVGCDCSACA